MRGKERNGQGTHKRGNDHLKFSRASGQRCGPTLHWYSVAMNKQGGQFNGALWANTRAVLQVFFFLSERKVCLLLQCRETRRNNLESSIFAPLWLMFKPQVFDVRGEGVPAIVPSERSLTGSAV